MFEPSTSEHVSARTIFDPITAIAPSADCKTYAIGYNNGSLLLAALQPSFTILHTLTTSRAPSPITSLSWHASSSKQKSDMLASQTADGDLRVWSVSKPPAVEPPRVIRVLKRPEADFLPGRTWISWSKNGRIIQFSETETWSWDVRTKHVVYETIPLVDGVKSIAAYGPTATLFTLGPDYTVQQYDVEQRQMVRNVRHLPIAIPPTPPAEQRSLNWHTSESEEEVGSPSGWVQQDYRAIERERHERIQLRSPQPPMTGTDHPKSAKPKKDMISPAQQTDMTGTSFSQGTQPGIHKDAIALTTSSPQSTRSGRKGSRLKQEVLRSPQEKVVDDLFPYIRARLSDVPYRPPRPVEETRTPDDLRKQMLSVVFGWNEDIADLVRDELSRHAPDSQHAIFLSKWLDEDPDYLAELLGATGVLSNVDWMLLALGTLSHESSSRKVVQVFVEKMLSKGDIHAAATLLLAIGDRTDAIEVYVSRNQFLEAVLLTCLVTPRDWQRQSHLVRRWGEHVVENSQQQLAIRCFSCTDLEPTDPWTSPSAQLNFSTSQRAMATSARSSRVETAPAPQDPSDYPEIFKKTLERRRTLDAPTPVAMPAPPAPFRPSSKDGPRVTPQTSALKLITSFTPTVNQTYKFPGLKSDDRTPTHNAALVTPIAESAIDRSALSPGGTGNYRMNNIRSINAALTARTPSGLHRHRLPSIGETPIETEPPPNRLTNRQLPTPADSGSDPEKERARNASGEEQSNEQPALILTSARYNPQSTPARERETPQTAVGPSTAQKLPFQTHVQHPSEENLEHLVEDGRSRTSSKSRKPDGLSIRMIPVNEVGQQSTRRPKTGDSYQTTLIDTTSEFTSPPQSGDLYRASTKSPSVSGRSIDQYISSLDQAQYYSQHARTRTQSNSSKIPSDKKSRRHQADASDDTRGRDDRRTISAAKRSPSSPVPMSPEDIRAFTASVDSVDSTLAGSIPDRITTPASLPTRLGRRDSRSAKEGKRRHRSRSGNQDSKSKQSSRGASRHASPEPSMRSRGRSSSRKASGRRSPSSPLPMVPSEEDRQSSDPAMRFVSADRARAHRSGSRRPSRDSSQQREKSPERGKHRNRSRSRQGDEKEPVSRRSSASHRSEKSRRHRHRDPARANTEASELMYEAQKPPNFPTLTIDPEFRAASVPHSLMDRKKKELAAAELEARRLSLARRPSAPNIPLPGQNLHGKSSSEGQAQAPHLVRASTEDVLSQRVYGDLKTRRPSTPRAMQVTSRTRNDSATEEAVDDSEVLSNSVYQTPNPEVYESPRPGSSRSRVEPDSRTREEIEELLAQLPRHPAYDVKIGGSRSNSKNRDGRDMSRSRGASRDRSRASPGEASNLVIGIPEHNDDVNGPRILPELAHLMSPPPPPPPPPAPPKDSRPNLAIRVESGYAANIPLPLSAIPNGDPPSAHPSNHRRGRSGQDNGSSQFMGKIRSFTGRMRSSSRGRDNMSKSPQQSSEESGPMPYETNVRRPPAISSVI